LSSEEKEAPRADTKGKRDMFRIRASNPSIDVNNARLRKRDETP